MTFLARYAAAASWKSGGPSVSADYESWFLNLPGYSVFPTVQSASSPLTFSITSGALPTGLSLDTATGEVHGTPTALGTYNFNLHLVDSRGLTADYAGSIVIGNFVDLVAATRGQIGTAITGIPQNFTSRRTHWASAEGDITNLKCRDFNWYMLLVPTNTGVTLTFKRYIEYPAGVFHQVLWSGANLSIASGATALSDVVISSVTGVALIIPAGAKFWERTVKTSAGTQNTSIIEMPAGSTTLGIDDGNSASDLGNSGTVPATAGVNTFGSAWIQGHIYAAHAKSFALIGDSLPWGFGDISSADSKFNSGWLARSVGQTYPYMKLAKAGWSASDLAGSAASQYTDLFGALPVTDAIHELGVNDLRLGRTKAQILADHQSNYARLGGGVSKWQTTITPRSDTTDAYATTTNQTPKTDGNMADLTPLNTDIRAIPANLTGIIEAADFAMSARNSNIWGGPFPPTTDGTHPTTAKAVAMAALYVP